MVKRWYEVTCDMCGYALNHYVDRAPSTRLLQGDGIVVKDGKHFCDDECLRRYLESHGKK